MCFFRVDLSKTSDGVISRMHNVYVQLTLNRSHIFMLNVSEDNLYGYVVSGINLIVINPLFSSVHGRTKCRHSRKTKTFFSTQCKINVL